MTDGMIAWHLIGKLDYGPQNATRKTHRFGLLLFPVCLL